MLSKKAALSNDEKLIKIMENLSEDQKDNLNKIRESVENIWGRGCFISDFTNHGIERSMRLIGYSYDILSSNTNNELTVIERYLLLASIYLYDIGIQCYSLGYINPKLIDDARKIAEERKLPFNPLVFTSHSAMKLDEKEEDFIIEYWPLLSATIISNYLDNYLFSPQFVESLKDFPKELKKNLIYICLCSKYSIGDFEEKVSIIPCRQRLIATILRLANEFDIGFNHLDEDEKQLRRDLKNIIHWLERKYASVDFSDNVINLIITLYPDDAENYGQVIQAAIKTNFCCRNQKLIETLNFYGYNVKLECNNDRKNGILEIIRDGNKKTIPPDILHKFKKFERKKRIVSNCSYNCDTQFIRKIEHDILNNDSPYKILVLGDVMLDSTMYMIEAPYGQVLTHDQNIVYVLLSEDSLQYKNLKIESSDRCSLGGAAGIMETLLAIPNIHVDFIGIIGDDHEGNEIQELFRKLQYKTQKNGKIYSQFYPIIINGYPTVTKNYYNCLGSSQGSMAVTKYRFDRENIELIYNNIKKYENIFDRVLNEIGTDYNCIIISDYQKGMINEYVIDWISEKFRNTKIFIDPKYNFEYYKKLNINAIIPNIKEASMGIQEIANISFEGIIKRVSESSLQEEDFKYLRQCLPDCDSFIIKSDINGAIIYNKDYHDFYNRVYIDSYPVDELELKSNIGCGDTFDAYFIIGRLKDFSMPFSVKLANIAAGIKRKKELGVVVSPNEIYEELNICSELCLHVCKNT